MAQNQTDTYHVGDGDQPVKLAVDITTNGLAWTRSFLITETNATVPIPNCTSKDATGDIIQTPIGSAKSLKGNLLHLVTKVELFWEDPIQREIEYNNITARYIIDDGEDGHRDFDSIDHKTNVQGDFTIVYLFKNIELQ